LQLLARKMQSLTTAYDFSMNEFLVWKVALRPYRSIPPNYSGLRNRLTFPAARYILS
jgi:hypothetical protein